MSLHNPPKSVLDQPSPEHQGTVFGARVNNLRPQGYTDAVIDQHTTNHAEHHDAQHAVLFRGTDEHPVYDGSDYPRHVHSTKHIGDHMTARDREHHDALLKSGEWSDTPIEVLKDEGKGPK